MQPAFRTDPENTTSRILIMALWKLRSSTIRHLQESIPHHVTFGYSAARFEFCRSLTIRVYQNAIPCQKPPLHCPLAKWRGSSMHTTHQPVRIFFTFLPLLFYLYKRLGRLGICSSARQCSMPACDELSFLGPPRPPKPPAEYKSAT